MYGIQDVFLPRLTANESDRKNYIRGLVIMLLKLIGSFLKIGCIAFGGGSALIPVIEKEIVTNKGFLSGQDYTKHTIVANITPGALVVKLACLAGHQLGGVTGMVACASAVAFPGALVTILLLMLLSQIGGSAIHQLALASVGISIFIIYLLIGYIQKVFRDARTSSFSRVAVFLSLSAFIVTCGGNLRKLLTILLGESPLWSSPPLIGLSTIDLLGLAFFVIFFTGGNIKSWRMAVAAIIAAPYLLLFGKSNPFPDSAAKPILQLLMFGMAAFFLIRDSIRDTPKKPKRPDWRSLFCQLFAWVTFMAIFIIPVFFLFRYAYQFQLSGILSTITSFGGGEAYLSVADGLFVATGKISATAYYGQIAPVANTLPGPILVKILSAAGYSIGFSEGGGIITGLAFAVSGFGISVGATCLVCVLANTAYTCFTDFKVFRVLNQWILPIICGLLLTVTLSMLCEMLSVTAEAGVGGIVPLIGFAFLFFTVSFLSRRFHWNDVLVLLMAGGVSVLVLNYIASAF